MITKLFLAPILNLSIGFFVIFFVIAYTTGAPASSESYSGLISMASFLFGIFLSFSISSCRSKLTGINQLLKNQQADLIFIYKLSKHFSDTVAKKNQELIDKYLIVQIDYKLIDFQHTEKAFYDLFDYCLELKPKTSVQEVAYNSIEDLLKSLAADREQIETLVQQKMSRYEWFCLLTLLGLISFFAINLNTGTLVSVVLSSLVATTAAVLMLVLRDLNRLRWQEGAWIFKSLHSLFLSLDLLPYYSDEILSRNKENLGGTGKIRIASYAYPYPDFRDKKIRTVESEAINERT